MPVEKQLVSDKLETTQDDIVTAEELKTRLAARDVKEFSYTATDGLRSYLEDNQSDKEEFKNMCTNILLEEGTPALLQGIATAAEGADLSDPNNITLTPEQRNMVAIISLYLFTTDQPSTLEDVVTYISEGTDDEYKPKDMTKTESTRVVLGDGTTVEGATPGTTVEGATPGTTVEGVTPGTTVEGAAPGTTVEGAAPGTTVEGATPGTTVEGATPGTTVEGATPGTTVEGATPGTTVEGATPGTTVEGGIQEVGNAQIEFKDKLDTQTPLDNAFNALETQFATLGEAFKIPGVKEAGKKHFDDLQTKMKGIADKLNTGKNRAKMEIAFQKVGIDPQNPRDMQDLPKIATLLMNSDETGLSEVGTVLHTGMMEGLSALSGSMNAFSTDLSIIQDKQTEKNTNLQVLIDGVCSAQDRITELSTKIDTPQEFAGILRLAKQYPTQVASGIDNQMSAGTDHLDGMLLPVNRSNSLRNARGNTEAEFVNRAQEKLISEATAENIGENVSYILENYQDTTINGEIVYFNKRQLQEQGLADENGTIKPNSDQLLAEAFQNKTIGGFSLSKMVHSLYDNKNFTLLDTDQAGDLRDASDEEQKEFFTSIAVAQDRPYTFTEKQTKQQVQAGELSKKLSGKPQEVKSKITQITNQKALKMNATMIEEPNADQGKLDFYKVANGGKEFYISSKEFGKFKKPHESMSKKETSRTADNALSEMDNLRIDYRTLALQKYNIQGLEKTRDITEQKTAAGVSEKKLQFTDKSNDTATFTLDIAKTDTPTIIFPETGKTIPTTLAHAENDITNATKYVSVVNTYTQRWTKNTDKRTDLQTKQLTFLDDHAQQLITGSKKPSNGTSHAGENGFGQDIDFSKGGITIANFAYDDKNQKLNYIPSQNTKEVIATAE